MDSEPPGNDRSREIIVGLPQNGFVVSAHGLESCRYFVNATTYEQANIFFLIFKHDCLFDNRSLMTSWERAEKRRSSGCRDKGQDLDLMFIGQGIRLSLPTPLIPSRVAEPIKTC